MTKGWQESHQCQDEAKAIYQRFKDKKKDKGVIFLPVIYEDYSIEYEKETNQVWTKMKLKTTQQTFQKTNEDWIWMEEIVNSISNSIDTKEQAYIAEEMEKKAIKGGDNQYE
eukprot:288064_1